MRDFNYEIKKRLGILSQNGEKTLELNLVSYNGREPKIDLRRWDRNGGEEKLLKGLTMTNEDRLLGERRLRRPERGEVNAVKESADLIQWTLENIVKKRAAAIIVQKRETAIIIYYDPVTKRILEDGGEKP